MNSISTLLSAAVVVLLSVTVLGAEKVKPDRFPIGFWPTGMPAVVTEQMVQDWADAGITLTYAAAENMEQVLDWCQQRQIQIVIQDGRLRTPHQSDKNQTVPADYRQRAEAVYEDYGQHPALYGFKVSDEPDPRNVKAVLACAKIATEAFGEHHALVNNFGWYPWGTKYYEYENVQKYRDYLLPALIECGVDIISYDTYYHANPNEPGPGWDLFFGSLYNYGEFARQHDCDLWNITFATPHMHYRMPDENMIRWQFNTSIAYGAKGVFYYTFYTPAVGNFRNGPIDVHGKKTPVYDYLARTHKKFLSLYQDVFLNLDLHSARQKGKVYGNVPEFKPDDLIANVEALPYTYHGNVHVDRFHPFVVSRFKDRLGKDYVMLVNNSIKENVNFRITFKGSDWRVFQYRHAYNLPAPGAYEAPGLARTKETCQHREWLAPGQEIVYRLEKP